jgi:hypothetical protein
VVVQVPCLAEPFMNSSPILCCGTRVLVLMVQLHDTVVSLCVEVQSTLEKGSGRSCEQYGVLLALYQMTLDLVVVSYAPPWSRWCTQLWLLLHKAIVA